MNCKIHQKREAFIGLFLVWLVPYICFGSLVENLKEIDNTSSSIEYLLVKDFKKLSLDNPDLFKNLNKEEFEKLFNEGLKQSIVFQQSFNKKEVIKNYRKSVNMSISFLQEEKVLHPLFNCKLSKRPKKAFRKRSEPGYSAFADFRGKWYGKWENNEVKQYWLSPKYINTSFNLLGNDVKVNSFQSVNIGDGIGWNYQVTINGKKYITGFTCHFNSEGKIYLKRPHVGISQSNNSIVWITKDHIYFEFICKSENCADLPLHYVISGVNFGYEKDKFKIKKGFQVVYTEEHFNIKF